MTSMPWSTRPLITRITAFSLPGMAREEKITRSPREKRDVGMVVLGDARERRARLALAAGAERHHLVGRQMAVDVDRAKLLDAVEIAGLARDLRDAVHGAADHDDFALAGGRGFAPPRAMRATLEAKVVTATRRGAVRISSASDFATSALRRRAALAHRVGGIADQREAALVAERAQLGLVGRRADHRRRIDLPVAGVQHGAERRADDQAVRFRDRMGHGNELDIERPEREAAAERHDVHRDFRRARLALALGLQQRGGERRGVDRQLRAAATDRCSAPK